MTAQTASHSSRIGSHRLQNEAIEKFWDDFTPAEVDWIDGRMNRLIHALVSKYGISRDEAARQVAEFSQLHGCDDE